jgi:hypothetical protein
MVWNYLEGSSVTRVGIKAERYKDHNGNKHGERCLSIAEQG